MKELTGDICAHTVDINVSLQAAATSPSNGLIAQLGKDHAMVVWGWPQIGTGRSNKPV